VSTATLSTKGQLVIPSSIRKALHLQPGDRVELKMESQRLIIRRDEPKRAKLVKKNGRKVLVAPPGAPPMTPDLVKTLLEDFP
jgi:AbrB family looped-hinge helix DNA binding protein